MRYFVFIASYNNFITYGKGNFGVKSERYPKNEYLKQTVLSTNKDVVTGTVVIENIWELSEVDYKDFWGL